MGMKARQVYEMAKWPGCCARGRARDMGCDDRSQTWIGEIQERDRGATSENQAASQRAAEQEIKYIPELLRFAGSMVPEPSTTSPRPFIVERV